MGDGCAAYPLNGLPILDEETLCAVFDISEKQLKNTSVQRLTMPDALNVGDTDPDERVLKDDDFSITYGGTEVLPLRTRTGIIFIQKNTLRRWRTCWTWYSFTSGSRRTVKPMSRRKRAFDCGGDLPLQRHKRKIRDAA